MRHVWAAVVMASLASTARAEPPRQANGVFVSRSYALTFTAPPGVSYCPLPEGWTGSDHGTILFLLPPRLCDGAGYPSMARGFEPPGVPRIEVDYERTTGLPPKPCRTAAGHARLFGRTMPLCASRWRGLVVRGVRGLYTADAETEAVFTLVTYPSRLRTDLRTFQALTATVRPCSIPWQDAQGRTHIEGSGPRCPENGGFY